MEIVTLRDGSRLLIRPIEPDDREALAEGHRRLSPESQYRRYFSPKPELHEHELDYLTQVDHHDHEALVAVDPETSDGVGVARYVRTGPQAAEPAIAVADDWQRRGVAGLLLDRLVDRARAEGIRRFEAPVLATNHEAIRVMERLGRTTLRRQGGEVDLRVELPAGTGAGPGLGTLLKEFATGALEPAQTLVERLWREHPRRGAADAVRSNLIVVGTDGSAPAAAAVEVAAELAAASGAVIDVVGAHRFLPPDHSEISAAVRAAAESLRDRGLVVNEHVRRGDPALVLTDIAAEENARLVVVGGGEPSKAARRLIGSVTDLVAERSPCDVLIVRLRKGTTPAARRAS